MGADLILMTYEFDGERDSAGYFVTALAAEAARVRDVVANASDDLLESAYDDALGEQWDDAEDSEHMTLRERFTKAAALLTEDRRDFGVYVIHGGPVLITGGMSWGDTPTDAYDELALLATLKYHAEHAASTS